MSVKCPKCRASASHLEARVEILEVETVQTVRCVLCGWRVNRVAPAKKASCAHRDLDRVLVPVEKGTPCVVQGCNLLVHGGEGVNDGICARCRTLLRCYLRAVGRARRKGPPIQQIGGVWYTREAAAQLQLEAAC